MPAPRGQQRLWKDQDMLDTLITSQHYISDEIVAAKIAAEDYEVQVSPAFEIDGQTFRVVMDGHHSLAAAIEAGVEPEIVEQNGADNDKINMLRDGLVQDFLEACWMDGDYHYAISGKEVW